MGTGDTSREAARFRGTRAAHRDESAEDYVEAIAVLRETHGEARVTHLARMMGVSHVTVSRIIRRLTARGLIEPGRHRPVLLTPAGQRLADQARARHGAVLAFLLWLGVSPERAALDAEGIEHHVSGETIEAMRRAVGAPGPGRSGRRRRTR
jgi:DtxR family manganese transport transcriptional regulator